MTVLYPQSGVKNLSATINLMVRKLILPILLVVAVIAGAYFYVSSKNEESDSASYPTQTEEAISVEENTFDKSAHSLTNPSSIWVIVNKQNSIPISYVPNLAVPDVRLRLSANEEQMQISSEIKSQVEELFSSASADGVELVFGSGYRSSNLQKQFYDSYVARDGIAAADTYSARPGHSEHQTGLAFDITTPEGICHLEICLQEAPQGRWVAENAHRYGFIIRYQKDKDNITGYQYEPWHLRYVGVELANEINNSKQTLEEFFELGPAPNYD